MTFRVGQQVVCISDHEGVAVDIIPNLPVVGQIYTVRGFNRAAIEAGAVCTMYLEEIRNPLHRWLQGVFEASFNPARFRPVVDKATDISFAHEILRKSSRTKETAA